ncbi:hypothetical protein B0H14DRAFT_3469758 [Mycena olivaceomarginata]|nr:hypothetical protein B0H14DRAFT_3469758 [Mycena olivaceomarginata]
MPCPISPPPLFACGQCRPAIIPMPPRLHVNAPPAHSHGSPRIPTHPRQIIPPPSVPSPSPFSGLPHTPICTSFPLCTIGLLVRYTHQRGGGLVCSAALPYCSLPNSCVCIARLCAPARVRTATPVPSRLAAFSTMFPSRPAPPLRLLSRPHCSNNCVCIPRPYALARVRVVPPLTWTGFIAHPPSMPVSVPLRKSPPAARAGPIKPLAPHKLTPSTSSLARLPRQPPNAPNLRIPPPLSLRSSPPLSLWPDSRPFQRLPSHRRYASKEE